MQAGLGFLAARTYLARHNTLHANGAWRATKTELDRGLLGAFAFYTEVQTLARGELHLDAWHRFNEVIYAEPVGPLRRIAFDFRLGKDGYLLVLLDRRDDGAAAALRLSALASRPSAWLELDGDGAFLRREVLRDQPLDEGSHTAVVEIGGGRVRVSLDDAPFASVAYAPRGGTGFGFRGGTRPVSIDEIEIETADGRRLQERFDQPRGAALVTAATVAATVLASCLLFAGLRRISAADDKLLGFKFFAANLVLLAVVGALYVFVVLRSSWYPRLDETMRQAELYFSKGAAEKVLDEIRRRYGGESPAGRVRLLFVGSSQTWGAGATHDEDVWVAVLERLLRARHGGTTAIECINAGISATYARDLEPLLVNEWLSLKPQIVVIDLSSNDRASRGRFRNPLLRMIAATRAAGAVPVLVQEPNSIELLERQLLARHADMAQIGDEVGVRVIPLQDYLQAREETGLLFWDKVHLTSYGQRLTAGYLADQLDDLVTAALERSGSTRDAAHTTSGATSPVRP